MFLKTFVFVLSFVPVVALLCPENPDKWDFDMWQGLGVAAVGRRSSATQHWGWMDGKRQPRWEGQSEEERKELKKNDRQKRNWDEKVLVLLTEPRWQEQKKCDGGSRTEGSRGTQDIESDGMKDTQENTGNNGFEAHGEEEEGWKEIDGRDEQQRQADVRKAFPERTYKVFTEANYEEKFKTGLTSLSYSATLTRLSEISHTLCDGQCVRQSHVDVSEVVHRHNGMAMITTSLYRECCDETERRGVRFTNLHFFFGGKGGNVAMSANVCVRRHFVTRTSQRQLRCSRLRLCSLCSCGHSSKATPCRRC